MKLLNLLLACSFSVLNIHGQVAIINDPDGYTNVRAAPGIDADIIYQVKSNEAFFYFDEVEINGEWYFIEDSVVKWVYVEIPQSRYSFITDSTSFISGYIHKSRLLPLEKLKEAHDDEAYAVYSIIPAIERKKDSTATQHYYHISGKEPFGLETGLKNSTAVSACTINLKGHTLNVPYELLNDLFNVSFEIGAYSTVHNRSAVYKSNETIYIYQECGDGAAFYVIVWCIKGKNIVQRLVGWIY